MAFMAVIGSKSTNGVAAIHSDIIKHTIFKDFYEIYPEKFQNKTNGVTPRRWLAYCNPGLRELITKTLGSNEWIKHLEKLSDLKQHAEDKDLQAQWRAVKQENKQRLAKYIKVIAGSSSEDWKGRRQPRIFCREKASQSRAQCLMGDMKEDDESIQGFVSRINGCLALWVCQHRLHPETSSQEPSMPVWNIMNDCSWCIVMAAGSRASSSLCARVDCCANGMLLPSMNA